MFLEMIEYYRVTRLVRLRKIQDLYFKIKIYNSNFRNAKASWYKNGHERFKLMTFLDRSECDKRFLMKVYLH